MKKRNQGAGTDTLSGRRERRMAAWADAKHRHGRRGWKARKKQIKRIQRDARRAVRRMHNQMIDQAALA